jgi:ABC-type cobalamin/Fe3+-siderophores transport system ATPase subunit
LELLIQNLRVSYRKRNILNGVSLSFSQGLHFIAGLNGSGKSTLLRALLQAIPYEGAIKLDGNDLSRLSSSERAQRLALVPQQQFIPFPVTAFEFVRMGRFPWLGWLGQYSSEDDAHAHAALAQLHATEFAPRLMSELSGGEQQKVFLASAICQASPVLLLDEPEHSLDPRNKAMLLELLRELPGKGKIVICATHETTFLQSQCDSITGIADGKVVLHESACEYNKIEQVVFGL